MTVELIWAALITIMYMSTRHLRNYCAVPSIPCFDFDSVSFAFCGSLLRLPKFSNPIQPHSVNLYSIQIHTKHTHIVTHSCVHTLLKKKIQMLHLFEVEIFSLHLNESFVRWYPANQFSYSLLWASLMYRGDFSMAGCADDGAITHHYEAID